MSPSVIAGLIGLALLAILAPIAIRDRRIQANDAVPLPQDPITHTTQPRFVRPMRTGDVALAVFLGLWLFVLSIAIPTMLILNYYVNQWNGR
jgi:hypothetical protein